MAWTKTVLYVVVLAVLYQLTQHFLEVSLPLKGGGYAAPGWRKVADVMKSQIDAGEEKGGILTVYHKGKLVVEFWGGYADDEARWAWGKDTLGMFCSTAKVVGALVIAQLVDRGLMSYSDTVTENWPEFSQNNKQSITIAQLLSHQAGLAIIEDKFSMYDILENQEEVGQILAAAKPVWPPGDLHGYHGITMGLYMDQLVRRIDLEHRSLSQYFQEEIAEAFNIDFFIGLPKAENYRVARIYPFDFTSSETLMAKDYWNLMFASIFQKNSFFVRSIMNPQEISEDHHENNPAYREIPSASSHGFGTGASIAKLLGIVANGGTHGDQNLLSPEVIQILAQPLVEGQDVILLRNVSYGPGVVIRKAPDGGDTFGHFGAGSQFGFADLRHNLAWSYLTNHHTIHALGDNPRIKLLEQAIYDCVHEVEKTQGA